MGIFEQTFNTPHYKYECDDLDYVIPFGKYRGEVLRTIVDPNYLVWCESEKLLGPSENADEECI
jgi:hypothetical protein